MGERTQKKRKKRKKEKMKLKSSTRGVASEKKLRPIRAGRGPPPLELTAFFYNNNDDYDCYNYHYHYHRQTFSIQTDTFSTEDQSLQSLLSLSPLAQIVTPWPAMLNGDGSMPCRTMQPHHHPRRAQYQKSKLISGMGSVRLNLNL